VRSGVCFWEFVLVFVLVLVLCFDAEQYFGSGVVPSMVFVLDLILELALDLESVSHMTDSCFLRALR
jgi:hypothetical protein